MVQNKDETVETFAIIPFGKYQAMEQRLQKAETSNEDLPKPIKVDAPEVQKAEDEETPVIPVDLATTKSAVKKIDLKNKYRTAQIKKLLQLIEKKDDSQKITSLENLDDLIKCALGNGRKKIPNEEEFFNFLFANNLAHFVKNRSKINQYYDKATNWYEV